MIHIEKFRKTYKDHTVFFEDLSFKKGINILWGPNGSGKTTLLKGLAGLTHAHIQGVLPSDLIYVEEAPFLPAFMKAKDYLMCLKEMGDNQGFCLAYLIDVFALNKHLHKRIFQLSKGMRQKLYLTTVLLEKRTLYLYDEPFDALDDQAVLALIALWRKQEGYIVATSHDLRHIEAAWVMRL